MGLIADATERMEFWTEVMRDEGEPTPTRLRASEMLSKALGDFDGSVDVATADPSFLTDAQLEAILTSGKSPF